MGRHMIPSLRASALALLLLALGMIPIQAHAELALNTDGSVLDTVTKLVWQPDRSSSAMTWALALDYCEDSTAHGYSDWRLPSVLEYDSILNLGNSPAMYTSFFNDCDGDFWTSTTDPNFPSNANLVCESDGHIQTFNKSNGVRVRCVRGGRVGTYGPQATLSESSGATLDKDGTLTVSGTTVVGYIFSWDSKYDWSDPVEVGTPIELSGLSLGAHTLYVLGMDGDREIQLSATEATYAITAAPEMDVTGNGQSIANGDASPSTADNTDFGNAVVNDGTVSRTFTITNSGNADLALSGSPRVALSDGTHFTVTGVPTTPVAAGGGTTSFMIQYAPTTEAQHSVTVSITNNDTDENPYTFTIKGAGVVIPAPEIEISGNGQSIATGDASPTTDDHTDFGDALVDGGTVSRTFTITNSGTADLTLSGDPKVELSDETHFTVTAGPSSPVASDGGTTSFTIQYDPATEAEHSATVTITSNDADESPYTFTIKGVGTPSVPEINITGNGQSIATGDASPATDDHTDFGSAVVDSGTVSRTFTITNTGSADLTMSGLAEKVALADGTHFAVTTQPDTQTVAPGGSTTFTIQFAPSATGEHTDTISLNNNDADESPYTFTIKGIGAPAPLPEIEVSGNGQSIATGDSSPTTDDHTDFGNALVDGGTVSRTFTITNSGTGELTLSGDPKVALSDGTNFSVTAEPSSPVFPGGGTTSFTIQYDPATEAEHSATVTITSNDEDESQYTFTIKGVGITEAPEMDVSGNGQPIAAGDAAPSTDDHTDFGSALVDGGTVSRTFTITNSGNGDLNLSGSPVVALGTGTHFSVTSQAATPVAAGGTTTFTVQFDPSSEGSFTDTVFIANNDANENPYPFTIQGAGTAALAPEINVLGNGQPIDNLDPFPSADDHTDFGSAATGVGTVSRTFTIENTGDGDLNLTGSTPVTLRGFQYIVTSQPTSPVPPGGTTTFTIKFDPRAEGTRADTVSIANDDSDESPYSFAITGEALHSEDSDHDGIPDAWEIANGLDPNNTADASEDFDGDGYSNVIEYLNRTDPNDANSFPATLDPDVQAEVIPTLNEWGMLSMALLMGTAVVWRRRRNER